VTTGRLGSVLCATTTPSSRRHFGERLWITRKGAVAAFPGRPGIIPRSMGAKSLIVERLGDPESFMS
jgi:tRNA-splicing ligase RtcB